MEHRFHFLPRYLNKRKPAELTSAHPSSSTVQSKPIYKEGILNRQRRAYKGHYEGKKRGQFNRGHRRAQEGKKEGKPETVIYPQYVYSDAIGSSYDLLSQTRTLQRHNLLIFPCCFETCPTTQPAFYIKITFCLNYFIRGHCIESSACQKNFTF